MAKLLTIKDCIFRAHLRVEILAPILLLHARIGAIQILFVGALIDQHFPIKAELAHDSIVLLHSFAWWCQ